MQTDSSSTSSSCSWIYDVFLNFRGEDTRKSFIDHLFTAFNQKGLRVFKDDKELERGKPISPELLQAIEESRYSVIVFSKNYASSTWCLDELVQIVHCKNIKFFPVFYKVDPSVVRKQTGEFQEAFVKHEETFREDIGKVQAWRNALTEVANHSGFDLKDRHESEFIHEIVKEISSKLKFSKYTSLKDLVGIDSRLEKLKKLISFGSDDVRMIGICGMGGAGKTTIARAAYEWFSNEFEGSCFLANVTDISQKDGLFYLQKTLVSQILKMGKDDFNMYNEFDGISMIIRRTLCSKKVLVVIDDVNHQEQLETLASRHDWFGLGSRIIITSRNKHLLRSHGVDDVYEAEELNDDEALQLFISKAFKKHQRSEKFRELSKWVVKYVGGLPLALQVLGSFLCGREVPKWKDALKGLNCKKEILDKLQISFDGLEESEKKLFLDIACFFKGENRDYVTRILETCDFSADIGIDILIEKSLISILDDHTLWVHDLLQQMGQQIVKRECPEEPGKRSRLWMGADIRHVLTENTGTEMVEGIMLNFSTKKIHCCAEAFSKMINLRLLKICNVQLPEGLNYLSNKLRLLDWEGYPLKSLPPNLQLDKIIELNLKQSRIEQLPQGIKPFNKLEIVNFRDCENLIKTPDFTFATNLKDVDLEGCIMLREVHPSLLVHKKITCLNLTKCTSLTTLPNQMLMEPDFCRSLKILILSDCNMEEEAIPNDFFGSFCSLQELRLSKNNFVSFPGSIKHLSELEYLDLNGCKRLRSLPELPSNIESINVNGCVALETTSNAFNSKLSEFLCINCLKLFCCNNLASSMPRESLKAKSKAPIDKPWCHHQMMFMNEFSMVFPGSEIPECFQHKSEASSIKIERPPDFYDNEMVGFAACCVFDFHELWSPYEDEDRDSYDKRIYCHIKGKPYSDISLGEYWGKTVSDHLWLLYLPEGLFQDFVELSFVPAYAPAYGPELAVKRCGIHPVYERELKELKPRTNKSNSSSFGSSHELDEDFLGSTVDVDCDGSKMITSPNFINGESSSRYEKEIEEYYGDFDDEDEPPSLEIEEYSDDSDDEDDPPSSEIEEYSDDSDDEDEPPSSEIEEYYDDSDDKDEPPYSEIEEYFDDEDETPS